MVNVGVRVEEHPTRMVWILGKVRLHVFVHFLLQIDPQGAIRANNFVRANAVSGETSPPG